MKIKIRTAEPGDVKMISILVEEVFRIYVAPTFDRDGIRTFLGFIEPEKIRKRMSEDHWGLIAEDEKGLMIGVMFFKGTGHINLFFVRHGYQRIGIGRELMKEGIERSRIANPRIERIDVNSAPGAVKAYERLGFKRTGEEKVLNGIRFVPMELIIL